MKTREELKRKIEMLEERVSALSAAVLRLGSSLDLATVLQEAADSARALTGTRYSLIVTLDEEGEACEFVTSGLTPEEHREFAEWPDGRRLFAILRDLPGPLRVADLSAFFRELGFSDELVRTRSMHGTSMRHRGVQVGNFFLGGKENVPDFTAADEEMLMLFASQAAAVIVNAQTHQQELRARADLEALVEITPVGVMVVNADTRIPVSYNREAGRMMEPLLAQDRPVEALPETLTCRFGDGREIFLRDIALSDEMKQVETVRAEEIVLSAPDGCSVSMLVNAAPILAQDGAVTSVVVTMQDLGPLEELDRQRTEFLSIVSHELRTPLAAIKGSSATVLAASPALDPVELHQFFQVIEEQADQMRNLIGDLLDAGRIDAGTLSVSPMPTGVEVLVEQARTPFLNSGGKPTILIDMPRDLPRVMADGPRIVQVLNNLLSNASRHSPGSSPIWVAAEHDGPYVNVSVSDEGKGMSSDQLSRLFRKYTSLGEKKSRRSQNGSGLGLAICKGLVEAHGGRIWAESGGSGQGTRFTFSIPVSEDPAHAPSPSHDHFRPTGRPSERSPVLVLDDDPQILRFVRNALGEAGFSARVTSNHLELPEIIHKHSPCLILLDLMLHGADGIELLETIQKITDVPIIFISAYGREETVTLALQQGADDYIVKPFSASELTARIQAVLRRRRIPEVFVLGDLTVHYEERRVTMGDREVKLTATEFGLLNYLTVNAGRTVTYKSLIDILWSGKDTGDPDGVRTFIKQLRHKLGEEQGRPTYILNERGVGYRMPKP